MLFQYLVIYFCVLPYVWVPTLLPNFSSRFNPIVSNTSACFPNGEYWRAQNNAGRNKGRARLKTTQTYNRKWSDIVYCCFVWAGCCFCTYFILAAILNSLFSLAYRVSIATFATSISMSLIFRSNLDFILLSFRSELGDFKVQVRINIVLILWDT